MAIVEELRYVRRQHPNGIVGALRYVRRPHPHGYCWNIKVC